MFRAKLCLAAGVGVAMLLAGCRCGRESPSPAPKASVAAKLDKPAPSAAARPQPAPPCRALSVTGGVRRQGRAPLSAGDVLDGRTWVELDEGGKVAVKHAETSRELILIGPGLALPCRRGEEQVLLTAGRFESTAGVGVRPGAEVLVATPAGVIAYADAAIEVAVRERQVTVTARSGEARVEAAQYAERTGGPVIRAPKGSARLVAGPRATPEALTESCREASTNAAAAAREVLHGSVDAGSLGARAAANLRARQAARSACASAAAAAAGVTDPAQRAGLWARVEHSDRLWRAIRSEPAGPNKP